MRRVSALLLFLLGICLTARASYVTNDFTQTDSGTQTIIVNFHPNNTYFTLNNGTIVYTWDVSATATNGILTTNSFPKGLAPGPYTVTFGPRFDKFTIMVPYDNLTYSLWSLITSITGYTTLSGLPVMGVTVTGNGVATTNANYVVNVAIFNGGTNGSGTNFFLNAINFGADPTGVADSTAAIQAAVNAAQQIPGFGVGIPGGTYQLNGTPIVNTNNIVIQGVGAGNLLGTSGQTLLVLNSSTGFIFSNAAQCAVYRDMAFSNSTAATAGAFITGTNSISRQQTVAQNCYFINGWIGIDARVESSAVIDHDQFLDQAFAGIVMDNGANADGGNNRIFACNFTHQQVHTSLADILIRGGGGTQIHDNWFTGNPGNHAQATNNVRIDWQYPQVGSSEIDIYDNHLDSALQDSVYCTNNNVGNSPAPYGGQIEGMKISGNTFAAFYTNGGTNVQGYYPVRLSDAVGNASAVNDNIIAFSGVNPITLLYAYNVTNVMVGNAYSAVGQAITPFAESANAREIDATGFYDSQWLSLTDSRLADTVGPIFSNTIGNSVVVLGNTSSGLGSLQWNYGGSNHWVATASPTEWDLRDQVTGNNVLDIDSSGGSSTDVLNVWGAATFGNNVTATNVAGVNFDLETASGTTETLNYSYGGTEAWSFGGQSNDFRFFAPWLTSNNDFIDLSVLAGGVEQVTIGTNLFIRNGMVIQGGTISNAVWSPGQLFVVGPNGDLIPTNSASISGLNGIPVTNSPTLSGTNVIALPGGSFIGNGIGITNQLEGINVLNYGQPTTDFGVMMNAAIAALPTDSDGYPSGAIAIPAGHYNCVTPIGPIYWTHLSIRGAGRSCTFITNSVAGASADMFRIFGSILTAPNSEPRAIGGMGGFTITGGAGNDVHFSGTTGLQFDDMYITNCSGTGMWAENTANGLWTERTSFDTISFAKGPCDIQFSEAPGGDNSFQYTWMRNVHFETSGVAVKVDTNAVLVRCHLEMSANISTGGILIAQTNNSHMTGNQLEITAECTSGQATAIWVNSGSSFNNVGILSTTALTNNIIGGYKFWLMPTNTPVGGDFVGIVDTTGQLDDIGLNTNNLPFPQYQNGDGISLSGSGLLTMSATNKASGTAADIVTKFGTNNLQESGGAMFISPAGQFTIDATGSASVSNNNAGAHFDIFATNTHSGALNFYQGGTLEFSVKMNSAGNAVAFTDASGNNLLSISQSQTVTLPLIGGAGDYVTVDVNGNLGVGTPAGGGGGFTGDGNFGYNGGNGTNITGVLTNLTSTNSTIAGQFTNNAIVTTNIVAGTNYFSTSTNYWSGTAFTNISGGVTNIFYYATGALVTTNSSKNTYSTAGYVAYTNGSSTLIWNGTTLTLNGTSINGTVTSVAAAADSAGVVSWSGSPITTSGTLTPTFSQAASSQFGVVKVDGTTITATAGVISAVGGAGGNPFTNVVVNPASVAQGATGLFLLSSNFVNSSNIIVTYAISNTIASGSSTLLFSNVVWITPGNGTNLTVIGTWNAAGITTSGSTWCSTSVSGIICYSNAPSVGAGILASASTSPTMIGVNPPTVFNSYGNSTGYAQYITDATSTSTKWSGVLTLYYKY